MPGTGPQNADITVVNDAGVVAKQTAQKLALVGIKASGAPTAANIVKEYFRVVDIKTDHGDGSDLHNAAKTAFAAGIPQVFAVSVDAKSGSPFSQTFGNASSITTGTLTAANLPLTAVTAATRDGVNILAGVKFTNVDPTTLTPAAAEVFINPKTGAFKLGTATTGSGAGFIVTYSAHDWDPALAELDENAYEIHVPANKILNAQNFGIFDKLLTHAADEDKFVAGVGTSGALKTDVDGPDFDISAIANARLFIAFVKSYSGDATSWFGATIATTPVNGTLKQQPAPSGIDISDSYLRSDFGNDVSPAAGTFHALGANAVYKDFGGQYRFSSDRSNAAYSNFDKWISTMRSKRRVKLECQDRLDAARQASSTKIPYTEAGMAVLKGEIQAALGDMARAGVIDDDKATQSITIPPVSSQSSTDKSNRNVPGIDVSFRLAGQVHTSTVTLNVEV